MIRKRRGRLGRKGPLEGDARRARPVREGKTGRGAVLPLGVGELGKVGARLRQDGGGPAGSGREDPRLRDGRRPARPLVRRGGRLPGPRPAPPPDPVDPVHHRLGLAHRGAEEPPPRGGDRAPQLREPALPRRGDLGLREGEAPGGEADARGPRRRRALGRARRWRTRGRRKTPGPSWRPGGRDDRSDEGPGPQRDLAHRRHRRDPSAALRGRRRSPPAEEGDHRDPPAVPGGRLPGLLRRHGPLPRQPARPPRRRPLPDPPPPFGRGREGDRGRGGPSGRTQTRARDRDGPVRAAPRGRQTVSRRTSRRPTTGTRRPRGSTSSSSPTRA